MITKSSFLAGAFSAALFLGVPFALADHHESDKKPAAPQDGYPLKTCVVSGEELGSMGDPIVYVHKEAGKPDRTVKFCCSGCIKDFKKEPAQYLKKIDDAAAGSAKAGKKADGASAAGEHKH